VKRTPTFLADGGTADIVGFAPGVTNAAMAVLPLPATAAWARFIAADLSHTLPPTARSMLSPLQVDDSPLPES